LDSAISDCQEAEKLDEKCIIAYANHSRALSFKNKLGAAIDVMKQAISKDKDNSILSQKLHQLENEMRLETMVPKKDPQR
jgi:hypothetical protein